MGQSVRSGTFPWKITKDRKNEDSTRICELRGERIRSRGEEMWDPLLSTLTQRIPCISVTFPSAIVCSTTSCRILPAMNPSLTGKKWPQSVSYDLLMTSNVPLLGRIALKGTWGVNFFFTSFVILFFSSLFCCNLWWVQGNRVLLCFFSLLWTSTFSSPVDSFYSILCSSRPLLFSFVLLVSHAWDVLSSPHPHPHLTDPYNLWAMNHFLSEPSLVSYDNRNRCWCQVFTIELLMDSSLLSPDFFWRQLLCAEDWTHPWKEVSLPLPLFLLALPDNHVKKGWIGMSRIDTTIC